MAVVFTTMNPRHLKFIMPIVYMDSIVYIFEKPKVIKGGIASLMIAMPVITAFYVLIKYQ